MLFKVKWIWLIYFTIFLNIIVQNIFEFFNPNSSQLLYFRILCWFDGIFLFSYYSTVIQLTLNLIHCIPLALYSINFRLFQPKLWKNLLIFRFIFDIIGHSYYLKYLTGFYHDSYKIFAIILISSIFIYVPSYWACYKYSTQSF